MSVEFDRLSHRLGALRSTVDDEGWAAATSRSTMFAKRQLVGARRRLVSGQIPGADLGLGPERANRFFWRGPGRRPTWIDVETRVGLLHDTHPDALEHFVLESLTRTEDPMVVVGLGRHPLTMDMTRSWLENDVLAEPSEILRKAQRTRLFGAAVVAVATLLLSEHESDRVSAWVDRAFHFPDQQFYEFLDSFGWCVSSATARPLSATHDGHRNRLVIVEHFGDLDSIIPLFSGATANTVIATSDTFGRADFARCAEWPNIGTLSVEHVRSRITRFSQQYIDLHEATARVAERAVAEISSIPELGDADLRPFVEVAMADFVFFQALKVRAMEELVADASFDDIVLAVGDVRRSAGFIRSASSVPGFFDDPRVRIVSVSRSAGERARFWALIDEVVSPSSPVEVPSVSLPHSLVLEKFEEDARHLAAGLGVPDATDRPSVCLVTTGSASYDDSTVGYAESLLSEFGVRMVCLGGDMDALVDHLDQPGSIPCDELAPSGARFTPLGDMLAPRLYNLELDAPTTPAEAAAAQAFSDTAHRLGREVVGPTMSRAKALHHWLENCTRAGRLPDAIMLTPQRTPWVGSAAAIARRFNVPTIAVEPHAQDANYSRYVKITADYYGVMSDYFRTQTSLSFGIGDERIRTLGSPRQVAPAGYDPDAAQRAAREHFTSRTGVVFEPRATVLAFFCQPSAWDHVEKVWDSVIEAAVATGSMLLLKTHPEDSASRTERYLERVAAHDARERVILLDTDAETAIALADIALTAYSAAAFDAVIRRTPVVVVTTGDVDYPVDLPAILGAPRARSADELAVIVDDFRTRPEEFRNATRQLLQREDHFVQGPGPGLRALVAEVIAAGASGIRASESVPASLFLDGPHPVFRV